MKTNFLKEQFLVLTNKENKIMAIIECAEGLQDIREKLTQSIAEDYDAILVNINEIEDKTIEFWEYETNFSATINRDEDFFNEDFTLTFATKY